MTLVIIAGIVLFVALGLYFTYKVKSHAVPITDDYPEQPSVEIQQTPITPEELSARVPLPSEKPKPVQRDKFGHKYDPQLRLNNSLNNLKAPEGYFWRTRYGKNSQSQALLTLDLLDSNKNQVDGKSVNLNIYKPHGVSWTRTMNSFPTLYDSMFNEEIIQPLLDFASTMRIKYSDLAKSEYIL